MCSSSPVGRALSINSEVGSSSLPAFPFYYTFYIIFKLLNKAQRGLLVKVELLQNCAKTLISRRTYKTQKQCVLVASCNVLLIEKGED